MNIHRRLLLVIFVIAGQCAFPSEAQEASPSHSSITEAEHAAVARYPALGVAGSVFHRAFLGRVQAARIENPARFADPSWPLTFADETAAALPPTAAEISPPADWYTGYSAENFGKLPAAQQKLDRQSIDHTLLSAAIFHATNAARQTMGLRPLAYLPALREAACEHSQEMATKGFFSHDNPFDPSKGTPSQRIQAHGIDSPAIGENIAARVAEGMTYWGYARAVVAQWMKSPGHRANILRANYTHLGCGAHPCQCPAFHMFATQDFMAGGWSARP